MQSAENTNMFGARRQPTWAQLIAAGRELLSKSAVPTPSVDARLLAEYVCGTNTVLAPEPTPEEIKKYASLIERRGTREPLQHITGRMWFRHLELLSRPGVFIVRPETEITVEVALDHIDEIARKRASGDRPVRQNSDTFCTKGDTKDASNAIRVMDLCTGSGAIALAIATERPGIRVSARDISPQAVSLSRDNEEFLRSSGQWPSGCNRVDFAIGDATGEVQPETHSYGSYDAVVVNPPYIPNHAIPADREVADYDPPLALYGGSDDGMAIPQKILAYAYRLLAPGGVIIMEHGSSQGDQIRQVMLAEQFINITLSLDLVRRPRVTSAEKA